MTWERQVIVQILSDRFWVLSVEKCRDVIESLEPLGYEAVRQKVGRSRVPTRAWLSDDWKTLHQTNNKWVSVSNQEIIRQRKERGGFTFHFLHLRYGAGAPPPNCPYSHNTRAYLYLDLFLKSELFLLTLHKRQVGQGNNGSPSKSFYVNATAVNYIRGHNDNVFAYRFRSREKGWSRKLVQRLKENILHLPSPALFR